MDERNHPLISDEKQVRPYRHATPVRLSAPGAVGRESPTPTRTPDGTVVQPLRTAGGYRFFSIEMLKEMATCSYRHHWYSFDELKSVFRDLAIAAYGDTGEYQIPG